MTKITYGGETVVLTCNLVDAKEPLLVDGVTTQYTTASARHRTYLAVALACRWSWPEVSWPDVPSVGVVPSPADCVAWDAWNEMEYETL